MASPYPIRVSGIRFRLPGTDGSRRLAWVRAICLVMFLEMPGAVIVWVSGLNVHRLAIYISRAHHTSLFFGSPQSMLRRHPPAPAS